MRGDVEYSLNRNETGWVVTLLNNPGNYKPQHGLGIPRREEGATVTLTTSLRRGARGRGVFAQSE